MPSTLTLEQVQTLAEMAHHGQTDKVGVPYMEHVSAVSQALTPFGDQAVMAGLLHDIIEDTPWTPLALIRMGVPEGVVTTVQAVTRDPEMPYSLYLHRVTDHLDAVRVKIADNAHNSLPPRMKAIPDKAVRMRLEKKYYIARDVLWACVEKEDIEKILSLVNPDLKSEFSERYTQ